MLHCFNSSLQVCDVTDVSCAGAKLTTRVYDYNPVFMKLLNEGSNSIGTSVLNADASALTLSGRARRDVLMRLPVQLITNTTAALRDLTIRYFGM